MEIEEYEIERWIEGFNDIRKVIQTSDNFVRWCIPTKRILNLLPPILDGYFLSMFILKFKRDDQPTFFLGYYKKDVCYNHLDFSRKGFCCQRGEYEDVEKIFLLLAKSTKQAHYIKASRKLAKVFIDNVYSAGNR